MPNSKQKKVHILVANSSEARCYATTQLGHEMDLLKQYAHPESREKSHDLVSDAPGHYKTQGAAHGAFVPHNTPHEQEVDNFARKLAEDLRSACSNNHYKHLVVIAPAHFYGLLSKHCGDQVSARIVHHIEKDYTKLPEKELQSYLNGLSKPAM